MGGRKFWTHPLSYRGLSRSRQWRPYSLWRNAQVVYELQLGEEVEGVRQEVREVQSEEKGEIKVEGEPHTS